MTNPFDDKTPPHKRGLFGSLRASFLTGLVVVAPVALTMYLIWTVVGWIDSWVLPFVPYHYRPDQYIGINLRGLGVIVFLIFTIMVGWVAKGFIGRSLIHWGENLGVADAGRALDLQRAQADCRNRLCANRHLVRQGLPD